MSHSFLILHIMAVRIDGSVEYLDGLKDTLGEKLYGKMCAPYDMIEFPGRYAPLRKAYEYHNRRFEGISEIEGRS